ncbi:MAG: pentapeptide repeat-containing protein [Sphingomonas sp.]|uniref:pentapeptide repeat-containing protein n=1 Tax=Sphingomonas sp. TaxID=28214 RepID=UPI0025F3E1BC|nr:hypothetical protein [Sphingomonas sp.]MBX3566307.1 pentapeptide repeat-containing protein [Sphingomonas sp.]
MRPDIDFRGVLLRGVDFKDCSLAAYDFGETIFETCRFDQMRFDGARIEGAVFSGCDPSRALDWQDCIASGARFTIANLSARDAGSVKVPAPARVASAQAPATTSDASLRAPEEEDWRPSGPAPRKLRPKDAFKVVERLIEEQRHPVLVLGAPGSGKTSLLMGVFETLMSSHDINTSLGSGVTPSHSKWLHHWWHRAGLFDHIEPGNYLRYPLATAEPPMLLPVDLSFRRAAPAVRLAFLESPGEMLRPSLEEDLFADGGLVRTVLEHYPFAVSMVYLAPIHNPWGDGPGDRILAEALCAYRKLRTYPDKDRHLLLLTKFDALYEAKAEPWHRVANWREEAGGLVPHLYPDTLRMFSSLMRNDKHPELEVMPFTAHLTKERDHPFGADGSRAGLIHWVCDNAITALNPPSRRTLKRALRDALPHIREPIAEARKPGKWLNSWLALK